MDVIAASQAAEYGSRYLFLYLYGAKLKIAAGDGGVITQAPSLSNKPDDKEKTNKQISFPFFESSIFDTSPVKCYPQKGLFNSCLYDN